MLEVIIHVCLERTASRQLELQEPKLTESAKDLLKKNLKEMFYKLESADAKTFAVRLRKLHASLTSLADLEARKESLPSSDDSLDTALTQVSQTVDDNVFSFFDGEFLTHLHGQIEVNGRWRRALHGLSLPLKGLRRLKDQLSRKPRKSDNELKLETRVSNLLAWLSTERPSVSVSVGYNDSNVRGVTESAMREQLDEKLASSGARSEELHKNVRQADQLQNEQSRVPEPHSDNKQQHLIKPAECVHTEYVTFSNEQLDKTLMKMASTIGASFRESLTSTAQRSAETLGTTDQSKEQRIQEGEAVVTFAVENAKAKAAEIAAWQRRSKEADLTKFFIYCQAYDTIIQQHKHFRNGGPPPNSTFIDELGMPDAQACICRLKTLWNKHSKVIEACDIKKLSIDNEMFMVFALCMREAHCLLHMLLYYGSDWTVDNSGDWQLGTMRKLQAEMVDFAHDEPLKYSKPDVDAICLALQHVSDKQAQSQNPQLALSELANLYQQIAPAQIPITFPGGVVPGDVALSTSADQHSVHNAQYGYSAQPGTSIQLAPSTQYGLAVQSAPGFTTNQGLAPSCVAQATHAEVDGNPMEIDKVCYYFEKKGGCNRAETTCPDQHPSHMKHNTFCPRLLNGKLCRFGEIGCRHRHDIFPVDGDQSSMSSVAEPVFDLGLRVPVAAATAPNGRVLDLGLLKNYCRDYGRGRCPRGNRCSYIHTEIPSELALQPSVQPVAVLQNARPNFSNNNVFQHGQPGAQSLAQQGSESQTPCRYLARGNCKFPAHVCKFSHDPAVFAQHGLNIPQTTQQPFSDVGMEGVVVSNSDNGPHPNNRRRPRSEIPCRNEINGNFCSNRYCKFMHTNLNSATYDSDSDGYMGDIETQQQQQQHHSVRQRDRSNSGHRNLAYGTGTHAQHDHRFDPTQHSVRFADSPAHPEQPHTLAQTQQPQARVAQAQQFRHPNDRGGPARQHNGNQNRRNSNRGNHNRHNGRGRVGGKSAAHRGPANEQTMQWVSYPESHI